MPTPSLSQSLARRIWHIAPTRLYTRLVSWLANWTLPLAIRPFVLGAFARVYGINTQEAEAGLDTYASLQSFFTRKLKPGSRPIDTTHDSIVSPSDGTVCDCGRATGGTMLQIKGAEFSVRGLLAIPEDDHRFDEAPYLIIYLSPRDYHRVHSPVSGTITGWTHVPGTLFPVGPASVAREPGLFAKNERFIIHIETRAGLCNLVMVAAVGVGHITCAFDSTIETHRPDFNLTGKPLTVDLPHPIPVAKGDELATFNLGSTTITLLEPENVALHPLRNTSPVKMGEPIGRMMVT